MDSAPHSGWVDATEASRSPTGEECRGFCTCGWQTLEPIPDRAEAQRLVELHQRNAQRRALAIPLGDLDEPVIRRVLQRMVTLMLETHASTDQALTRAREEEANGQLDGQLVLSPSRPPYPA